MSLIATKLWRIVPFKSSRVLDLHSQITSSAFKVSRFFSNAFERNLTFKYTQIFSNFILQLQKANYVTTVITTKNVNPFELDEDSQKKMNNAARMFMERSREYEEMIQDARLEYKIGLRHLANMMGEDPETFTQKDANVSITDHKTNPMKFQLHSVYVSVCFNFCNICRKLFSTSFHLGFMIKKRNHS